MQVKRSFLFPLICMCLVGSPLLFAAETDPGSLLEAADATLERVVRVRDLDLNEPVQRRIADELEIAAYIQSRIREEYDYEDLKPESRTLQILGLVPIAAAYRDSIFKLLSESVESRYDPKRNIFYIASWLLPEEQGSILAHESARILQDQHFDIENLMEDDRTGNNNDRVLAHRAFFEGDRTVVMIQMGLEEDQRHFSDLPNLAYVMQSWMATALRPDDASETVPEYLKQTLIFPYGYGASFFQEVWKNNPGWVNVNRIYDDLPMSTEQILHPEKYFGMRDNPKPVVAMDPVARLGGNWRIAYQNVLGEFSLGLLLGQHFTEEYAAKTVSGWGGDTVMYLEDDTGQDAVLVNTTWDSEEAAERFFTAMDAWFMKRYPEGKRDNETANGFSITHEGRFHTIERDGDNLYFILGLPETDSRKWLGIPIK